MAKEVVVTENNFDTEILGASEPVLVDFWAAWCGPCKMIAPVVEELANEYDGKLKVGKLNVDENSALAARYGVMSIPTLIVFKGGQEMERIIGFQPKEALKKVIDPLLN